VAAGGLVAAALAIFGLPGGSSGPSPGPPVATGSQPTKPPSDGQSEVTVYFSGLTTFGDGERPLLGDASLFPSTVDLAVSGDKGLDAVRALLQSRPTDPDYSNQWGRLDTSTAEGPLDASLKETVTVNSVTATENSSTGATDLITVDFAGPVDDPWNAHVDWAMDPAIFAQQLVWTVQNALNTEAPVLVTMEGEPVEQVLTADVRQPIGRDPSALAPIQIESPAQGETVFSPVTVAGQVATFEGNVVWRVKQNGEVVESGFTTSEGANGVFGPFEFTVELPAGDYTVETYEESAENGEIINLDSKDFTVESGGAEATTNAPTTSEMTVYMLGSGPGSGSDYNAGRLFPQRTTAPDTGEPGLDAVNALLKTEPVDPDYMNVWSYLQDGGDEGSLALKEEAISVPSVTERDGVITVDFSGPVDSPWEGEIGWVVDPRFFSQQLVWTVQDALDSKAPLLITMDGEPVERVLTAEVDNPIERDPYVLASVQIEHPAQGETVSSPVRVSGQSATYEATVVWRVKRDGEVVEKGFTTSEGANGIFGPFKFNVDLPPGDYTVEAYEESAENGEVVNLDSKDFTVE